MLLPDVLDYRRALALLPLQERACSSNPRRPGKHEQEPRDQGHELFPLCKEGHLASGSHRQKAPKPLAPHPLHPTQGSQVGNWLWQWVQPRPALPASSPCSMHQLYLPRQAMSWLLSPAPSVPLDFSGASPV